MQNRLIGLRRSAIAAVALLFAHSYQAQAQGAAAVTPAKDPEAPKRIVMPASVNIPLVGQAPNGSGRPAVEIRINGRGPYRFLVETGSSDVGLSASLADSLGLRFLGHDSDGPQFHVDSINIGAASFQDLTVTALPPEVTTLGISGVLGLSLYRNVLLTIDYPGQMLRISRDTLPVPNGEDVVPMSRVNQFWGLPIRVGDHEYIAVLDTQNSGALMIPPVVGDELAFDGGLRVVGKARGQFGTVDVKGGRLSGDIAIGKYRFPKPFLGIAQLPPNFPNRPNVGSGILHHFVVSIDQRHARLRLIHDGPDSIELAGPGGGHPPGGN